jgi:malignant T-cell-amplified sequence
MPSKQRRYSLKSKEAKQVLSEASQRLKMDLDAMFGSKANVEVVESEAGEIYLIGAKPLMFKAETVLPLLTFNEFVSAAPKIVVDMGAVPYVCKGANVMAPGIRKVDGEFVKGDLLVIVDEKHGKALALGESLLDAATLRETKKGPVIKTLHYVSDKYWAEAKLLAE